MGIEGETCAQLPNLFFDLRLYCSVPTTFKHSYHQLADQFHLHSLAQLTAFVQLTENAVGLGQKRTRWGGLRS